MLFLIITVNLSPIIVNGTNAPKPEESSVTILQKYHMPEGIKAALISSNGKYIAAGGKGTVSYFTVDKETPVWTFVKDDLVDSVSMSPDGRYIVVGMEYAMTYFFTNSSRNPVLSIRTDGPSLCTDISDDGSLFAIGTFFGGIYLIDAINEEVLWYYKNPFSATILSITISSDAAILAAGTSNNEVLVFSREDSTPIMEYSTDGFIHSLDLSQDGRYLVAGSNSSSIYFLDVVQEALLWSYTTNGSVRTVSVSHDGEFVAAGSYDEHIYFFEKTSNKPKWIYQTQGLLKDVSITLNKDLLVTGGTDRKLRVLDVSYGSLLIIHNSTGPVNSVSSSHDGNTIVYSDGAWVNVLNLTRGNGNTRFIEQQLFVRNPVFTLLWILILFFIVIVSIKYFRRTFK